jgi:hypothetical protein
MVARVRGLSRGKRLALLAGALLALALAGYGVSTGFGGRASADPDDTPPPSAAANPTVAKACTAAVLSTLRDIAMRVYDEGVSSERTASAAVFVERSAKLREAVERDDAPAAKAAAQALIATGHMSSLEVTTHGGQLLAQAGTPSALAPLRGSIPGANGAPIASFVASVWSDEGFLDETNGIAEAQTLLRQAGRNIAGSFPLPADEPAGEQGELTARGVAYVYTSLPASAYPEDGPLRIYLIRSLASIAPLCGSSANATVADTLERIARLIYVSEGGAHALAQVKRVQHNRALLQAVAAHEPEATRLAIDKLLNQHIVRMRVSSGDQLLSDVGGPYVLAPVRAPLRLHGRRIGSLVLSIQDDEGYKRLAERLAGLDVLMYMEGQLVKNSLGPEPGQVPASGPYVYRGHRFDVYTLHAEAFPSGPLRIVVLIPVPYLTASSEDCLSRKPSKSCAKESVNLATPSRSRVSVRSS